jgi:hypothetical protein
LSAIDGALPALAKLDMNSGIEISPLPKVLTRAMYAFPEVPTITDPSALTARLEPLNSVVTLTPLARSQSTTFSMPPFSVHL